MSNDVRKLLSQGACLHRDGQLEAALQSFERALAIEPRHIQARSARAAVLSELGRHADALQAYRKALHLASPDEQPQLLVNMGVVMELMGDDRGALQRYDQALRLRPDFVDALLNRGALLLRLKRWEEALANNHRLAERHPEFEPAQYNLGETLLALGRWGEALAAFERALVLAPAAAKTHFAKCLALSMLRRFDEAQQALDTAKSLDAAAVEQCIHNAAGLSEGRVQDIVPKVIYLLKESQRMYDCDWTGRDEFIANFEHLVESSLGQADEITERALAFRSLSLPISGEARLALAKSIAAHVAAGTGTQPGFIHRKRGDGKLRVGYVSPDFRVHPTAFLTRRLYALHDREKFEIYGYSLHAGDGSEVRRDIEQGCDVCRELSPLDDRAAAEIIHGDGIDVLIDLAGYTTHSRTEIFAMRPAPIQAGYLGFPCSMGALFMDYYLADRVVVPPGAERGFTEKLIYLPDSYFMFDDRHRVSSHYFLRAEFGLPEDGFVFCCFNNSYKIEPVIFDIWMRLLQRVPGSVLWLLHGSDAMVRNLSGEAESRGVSASRLIFAPFMPNDLHVARYRLADLFLDTLYYNAHTTAAEALWMSLPVLTCPGEAMPSRVAASLLAAVGLDEMVIDSLQQYEECACHLASHPDELARVREKLARNRLTMPLFATERKVRNLETTYQAMWQHHISG